ncbi:MAG: hypothetical protein AB7Q16_00290 [Vicinamibacterales bacterium]
MRKPSVGFLGLALALLAMACGGGSAPDEAGGTATVVVADQGFDVDKVTLTYAFGEDGYFRVEGNDAAHANEDCLPGLGGGLALYGEMPAAVTSLADLAGHELPFEFSGDGDDFNLCFVGSNGLLGVERGTVRFDAVDGTTVRFSFSGSFILYDGEGGESPGALNASGQGTAHALTE